MNNSLDFSNYGDLLRAIKQRVRTAQYNALKTVNKELISLYWDIGRLISERQKESGWGKSIVEQLARDLQNEFPGVSGFSLRNIWYMRNFYCIYGKNVILQPLVAEIGWTHNLIIMEKCKDDLEREFYIRMTHKMGWSKSALIHQIKSKTYERTLLNQTNFNLTLPEETCNQAKLAIKDEYTFDFLELEDEFNERQLEQAILSKLERFLKEMGGIFAFVENQYRLGVNNKEYYVDLLLYHRHLKCLVAIDLKIGEFIPEYVGKMQFYLTALDDLVRLPDENSSIGIILVKNKDKTIVEYALKESKKPIGVAQYQIVSQLPTSLQKELPSPEQIRSLIKEIS